MQRFMGYMARDHAIYFLYTPRDSLPLGGGPSAWGAAALLNAVDEGLAGVVDLDCQYREIRFEPRFVVTDYTELRYITGYEKSAVFVDVRFTRKPEGLRYDLYGPARCVQAHILLPAGEEPARVLVGGEEVPFTRVAVADSVYADFGFEGVRHNIIEVYYKIR